MRFFLAEAPAAARHSDGKVLQCVTQFGAPFPGKLSYGLESFVSWSACLTGEQMARICPSSYSTTSRRTLSPTHIPRQRASAHAHSIC